MPSFDGLVADTILELSQIIFAPTSSAWPGFGVTNNYAVRATTVLVVTSPGSYNFFLGSDDGSLLFIDGSLLIDNNKLQSFKEKMASITLAAGVYSIEVIEMRLKLSIPAGH